RTLTNRLVEVTFEATGALALHDRRSGERFFDVLRLEDGGDAGDTYTYCPPVHDRLRRSTGPIAVRRLAAGPFGAGREARLARGEARPRDPGSGVLRVRVDAGGGSARDAAPRRGPALPRRSAGAPGARRLADGDARRPVPRTGADRAGHRAGVGGGPGARRPDHRALGGRVSSGARALAAGRRATGDPGGRDRPRRDGTHSVRAQAGAERLGVRAALLQRDGPGNGRGVALH